jgi:hypothetical protein
MIAALYARKSTDQGKPRREKRIAAHVKIDRGVRPSREGGVTRKERAQGHSRDLGWLDPAGPGAGEAK